MALRGMVKTDDELKLGCAPEIQLFSFALEEIVLWDSTLIDTYDIREVFVVRFYDVLAFTAIVLIIIKPTGGVVIVIVVIVIVFIL